MQKALKTMSWSSGLLIAGALLVPAALTGCEERPAREREIEPAPPPATPPPEHDPFMDEHREAQPPGEEPGFQEQPGFEPGVRDRGEAVGEQRIIDVTLRDGEIDMPTTLPAGPVRFRVTNVGEDAHNFAIDGPGFEERLNEDLEPGETGTLEANLRPGQYRVVCPVGNHEEEGMRLSLNVVEPGQQ